MYLPALLWSAQGTSLLNCLYIQPPDVSRQWFQAHTCILLFRPDQLQACQWVFSARQMGLQIVCSGLSWTLGSQWPPCQPMWRSSPQSSTPLTRPFCWTWRRSTLAPEPQVSGKTTPSYLVMSYLSVASVLCQLSLRPHSQLHLSLYSKSGVSRLKRSCSWLPHLTW